ncbi:hypothetical protein HUU05_14280 [candidate division KSB1 bacterium]|nr:hypothetical protein [candidate division KSB1 bacterium]
MKKQNWFKLLPMIILLCGAYAQAQTRSAGIGIRGTYWDMNRSGTLLRVENYNNRHLVDLAAGGGWLSFFSRTSDSWFLEFSLGGIAKEVESVQYIGGEDTHVLAVVPVLVGMRYHLLPANNRSALRPYLAFGAGPYWVADVLVHNRYFEEETRVESELFAGGYVGGGLDFMICDWFGLNFDVRRHFVSFNRNNEHSGYEYGAGLQFMWGNYRSEKNSRRERCCH